ncbi:MAG: protein YgfX [Deefgea sp.]
MSPASSWRRGFLLLIFSFALLSCIWLKSLLSIALATILLFFLVFYWRRKEMISQLLVLESGELEVRDQQGQVEIMRVLPSSVVTEMLVVLHLKNERRKLAVVVWPDSAPSEVLRQWRVWLRWTWPSQQDRGEPDA